MACIVMKRVFLKYLKGYANNTLVINAITQKHKYSTKTQS